MTAIDTSNYDINNWQVPDWLDTFLKKHLDVVESYEVKLLDINVVHIPNIKNDARAKGVNSETVKAMKENMKKVGFRKDKPPCICISNAHRTTSALSGSRKSPYFIVCTFHRSNAGKGTLSHLPYVVINLKPNLLTEVEQNFLASLSTEENNHQDPQEESTEADKTAGYKKMVATYMVKDNDGNYKKPTQTEKLEYLREELNYAQKTSNLTIYFKEKILKKLKSQIMNLEHIRTYTNPELKEEWYRDYYSGEFEYLGKKIDMLNFSKYIDGNKEQPIYSVHPNFKCVVQTMGDKSNARDRDRLIENLMHDEEHNLDRHYFIIFVTESTDDPKKLNEARLEQLKAWERWMAYNLIDNPYYKEQNITVLGWMPCNDTSIEPDDMSTILDINEFKENNRILY